MVFKASERVVRKDKDHSISNKELVLQPRRTKSPTIEDDFTIDLGVVEEEEPFDEPKITPRAESKTANVAKTKDNRRNFAPSDAEIDLLSWTGSDLDVGNGKEYNRRVEDKSKSVHSLVWSASDLDDVTSSSIDNTKIDGRDEAGATQGIPESREDVAKNHGITVKNSAGKEQKGAQKNVQKVGHSKSSVQFSPNKEMMHRSKKSNSAQPATRKNEFENIAIRTERSTDSEIGEDESNIYDGISAFSVTPSVAPSVAVSVTKRTSNTRNPKSSRTPRTARPSNLNATETTTGNSSVMTDEVLEETKETKGACSMGKKIKKHGAPTKIHTKSAEEADILDRFFENIESHTCKNPRRNKSEQDGLKRLINPFLDGLEQFDCLFEHLEEMACPEEDKSKDESQKVRPNTPAAFAAATFTQLLNQIEKLDPGFVKSKAASCGMKCDIYGGQDQNADDSDSEDEDEDMSKLSVPGNDETDQNSTCVDMEENCKRAGFENIDQLQKMKEQWNAAKSDWKLKQSILSELVRQNTAKAAETTTKYMETIVSSCHPAVETTEQEKDNQDSRTPIKSLAQSALKISHNGHDGVTSIANTGSNILSPSEHSNVDSSRRNSRSIFIENQEHFEDALDVLSDGPSDEAEDEDKEDDKVNIGAPNGPLAVIAEGVESAASGSASTGKSKPKKDVRRWAYPGPTYYNDKSHSSRGSQGSSDRKEWIEMIKSKVDSVSSDILDRTQCASANIDFSDSASLDGDEDMGSAAKKKRMRKQNSIVEDGDYSVSVLSGAESEDNDDLSAFETAANTLDFEQDERPPMLRLMKSRASSRSCGSGGGSHDGTECNKSVSKSGSVQSRLSTEVPEGYTLADSIRHASLSDRNKGANRTRMSKEPRGNKIKTDPSSHVRVGSLELPVPQKPDPDCKEKDQARLKSPKSSETNETSDMTAVSTSSSDIMVTQMADADSTHSSRSEKIDVESTEYPSTNKPIADDATVVSYKTYNTSSSSGSTEFKDCYQDAIPSMSTMGTVPEDENFSLLQTARKQRSLKKLPGHSFLGSNANIVKSVALLSVSATVLKSTRKAKIGAESDEYEMESVPSASSYAREDVVLDAIQEEIPEVVSQTSSNSVVEESPMEEEQLEESSKEVNSTQVIEALHRDINSELTELKQNLSTPSIENNAYKESVAVDKKMKSDDPILGGLEKQESVKQEEIMGLESYVEEVLEEQPSDEPMDFKPDVDVSELSERQQPKQEYVGDDPLTDDLVPDDEVKSTPARTKTISTKLREIRSVEDRRKRRLRQRRKFEKILRGEDDSSSMSSSTMSDSGSRHVSGGTKQIEEEIADPVPLISSSFDTGFGSVPVIEESQF